MATTVDRPSSECLEVIGWTNIVMNRDHLFYTHTHTLLDLVETCIKVCLSSVLVMHDMFFPPCDFSGHDIK